MSFVRQHKGAVVWSAMLHIAIGMTLAMGIHFPSPPRAAVAAAPIQGVIVDSSILEREVNRREQAVQQERQRVQREERQRRDAERARTEAEQKRVADQQRVERLERERVAAEKRREEQAAQEQRQREVRERTEREEAAKREAAAATARRQQQQAEDQLQRELAAEAERTNAERAGLLDQYIAMIENQIERRWIKPLSVQPGLDCIVAVVQLPTGDVMSAKVTSCNGDEAVRRSIERAVMDASPLPKPPNPALFERNLSVRFRPDF
jgi:colicin import membrane protein